MSKCPHCGGEIQFSVEKQKVHCNYCGADFDASELVQDTKKAKKVEDLSQKETLSGKSYLCSQCGATLLSFDETAVTFCSYCGSQNVLEDKLVVQTAPDFIIPFSKTQEECIANYKEAITNAWFCPNYMKSDLVVNRFRGIYMPYELYNLHFSGDCVNKGEKYADFKDDFIYYDQYDLHSEVDSTCNGISFDLLSKYYDEYSQSIPFDYKEAKPFNSNYLPGFYADCKDLDESVYDEKAIKIAENISRRHLMHNPVYMNYNCQDPKVPYQITERKTGLCPVYFTAIRDKDNKHLHYAIINGQTGKVCADLPVDFKKYLLFSILFAIPLFFFVNSLGIIFPSIINGFALFAAIAGTAIFLKQLIKCNEKEKRDKDIGYYSHKKDEKTSKEKTEKTKQAKGIIFLANFGIISMLILTGVLVISGKAFIKLYGLTGFHYVASFVMVVLLLWFFLFNFFANIKGRVQPDFQIFDNSFLVKIIPSVIIPTIIVILNPISDYYYYISSVISLSLILLSFYDLVKLQNKLASRPIPQLEKRGGDEHE